MSRLLIHHYTTCLALIHAGISNRRCKLQPPSRRSLCGWPIGSKQHIATNLALIGCSSLGSNQSKAHWDVCQAYRVVRSCIWVKKNGWMLKKNRFIQNRVQRQFGTIFMQLVRHSKDGYDCDFNHGAGGNLKPCKLEPNLTSFGKLLVSSFSCVHNWKLILAPESTHLEDSKNV